MAAELDHELEQDGFEGSGSPGHAGSKPKTLSPECLAFRDARAILVVVFPRPEAPPGHMLFSDRLIRHCVEQEEKLEQEIAKRKPIAQAGQTWCMGNVVPFWSFQRSRDGLRLPDLPSVKSDSRRTCSKPAVLRDGTVGRIQEKSRPLSELNVPARGGATAKYIRMPILILYIYIHTQRCMYTVYII